MSLVTQIQSLIVRLGTEFKSVRSSVGTLANLTTTTKSDLVAALNELNAGLATKTGINDATTATTSTWSSNKIQGVVDSAIAALVNSAPTALDTLGELATQLAADEGQITAILTALGNRVRVDAAQTFTEPQKQQARDNIDVYSRGEVGDVTADLVSAFNAAIV